MYVRNAKSVNAGPCGSVERNIPSDCAVCQIPGCSTVIPRRHLMCSTHWLKLPLELREAVNNSLSAWLAGEATVQPYAIARLKALIHVARLVGGEVWPLEEQLARREGKTL